MWVNDNFMLCSFKSINKYIDDQFEKFFHGERGLNRRNIADNRVHCCFYFVSPFGHGYVVSYIVWSGIAWIPISKDLLFGRVGWNHWILNSWSSFTTRWILFQLLQNQTSWQRRKLRTWKRRFDTHFAVSVTCNMNQMNIFISSFICISA